MTTPVGPAPMTPRWWLQRLYAELRDRQEGIELHQRYVDGDHDDPTAEEAATKAFRRLMGLSKTNLSGLIVEATAEPLEVQGFRFGDEPGADDDAWRIWQASDFDAEAELLFTAALTVGRSFLLVEPRATPDDWPRLYAEDASQMVVAYAPGRRTQRLAALKVWRDDWTEDVHATVYLPDELHRFRNPSSGTGAWLPLAPRWEPRGSATEPDGVAPNVLGEVPVFELRNRPQLRGTVRSEVSDVLHDQDRANQIALNMLIAMEYGAFPQKYATGLEPPVDPNTGEPVSELVASLRRMWILEDPNARLGALPAADIGPYLELYEATVKHMAAVTRTPVSYLLGGLVNISAEALALSVSGLVNKVRRRARHFEAPLEEGLRCAFRAMGDPRGAEATAQTIWANPEIRTPAQDADAALKLVQGGVIAAETAQERYLGMSETERRRDARRREDADALGTFGRLLDAQAQGVPAELASAVPTDR